jgi:hypothetical protein
VSAFKYEDFIGARISGLRIVFLIALAFLLLNCGSVKAQFFSDTLHTSSLRVGDQLIVNYFESDPDVFETHLVITDVEGSGAVVNVLIYDDKGALVNEESYFLPMFGKVNYNPTDRLKGKKMRGSIRIVSDGGNVAAQYWQFYKDRSKGPFNTAIAASDGQGASALLCQHFVSDNFVDSKLILCNPESADTVVVAVVFYLDRGKQLSRDRYMIPPNGQLVILPYEANEGLIKTGLAYCEVLRGGMITGEYWQSVVREDYQVSLPLEMIPKRERDW